MEGAAPEHLATTLLDRIVGGPRRPVFLGIDGRSGSGKSTLAAALARLAHDAGISITVIEGDQFYGGGSAATWDRRSTVENVDAVIDWRRQRDVLRALRDEGSAEWRCFDWNASDWDGDPPPWATDPVRATATGIVVLEGAYSCRPELHELLDLRVLLEIPSGIRRQRLLAREGEAYRHDWEARWSTAEEHYFGLIMRPARFDVVLGA